MTKSRVSTYPTTTHIEELWWCDDCGCTVRRLMKTVKEEINYPDGKIIETRHKI
jgi:hypothetical protein